MVEIKINNELRSLSSVLELLKLLQSIDDKVDVTCYGIFLLICFQDGINNENIKSYFPHLNKARVSRCVHILCDIAKTRKDRKGLSLIKQAINSDDYRRKELYLTDKGKHLKQKIIKLFK